MYHLNKHETAHTTNFKSLKELAICLGNSTLPRLAKAKNLNYESEMTMQEMVRAISETVEEHIIKEAALSPHYFLIFDEATHTKNRCAILAYLDVLFQCLQFWHIYTCAILFMC